VLQADIIRDIAHAICQDDMDVIIGEFRKEALFK
jgi:hypothetical protein